MVKPVEWTHWTKQVCVLSWCLSKQTQSTIEASQLRNIHSEILTCMELVGAYSLVTQAMHGLICVKPQTGGLPQMASHEDSMVRLGQLLCRWAAEQNPVVGLRLGVDTGELKAVALPGQEKLSYYGPAYQRGYLLAECAPKDLVVHLGQET